MEKILILYLLLFLHYCYDSVVLGGEYVTAEQFLWPVLLSYKWRKLIMKTRRSMQPSLNACGWVHHAGYWSQTCTWVYRSVLPSSTELGEFTKTRSRFRQLWLRLSLLMLLSLPKFTKVPVASFSSLGSPVMCHCQASSCWCESF